ncbi:MAG: TraR/DksA C4-type zinc finger protein [Prevotellaceae bacterium]|nr:TraR/DksA C4-type zinc finger protein [Prevotellaceae bacterium]
MTERKRYSDEELMEFKDLILQKMEVARSDYDQIVAALTHRDNNSVDDTSPTYKVTEEGYATQSKEELNTLAARQKKFIDSLQGALVRIENKTYGVCRVTGKLIPKERLRAVPHATLSIEAKQMKNRKD